MTATRQYTGKVFQTDAFTKAIKEAGLSVGLVGMTSDLAGQVCDVIFDSEPTSGDDTILDGLAAAHDSQTLPTGERIDIMRDIFYSAEPTAQAPRLIGAIDALPSFVAMLDQKNWPLARSRAAQGLTDAIIEQDDYDLIDSKLPDHTE